MRLCVYLSASLYLFLLQTGDSLVEQSNCLAKEEEDSPQLPLKRIQLGSQLALLETICLDTGLASRIARCRNREQSSRALDNLKTPVVTAETQTKTRNPYHLDTG